MKKFMNELAKVTIIGLLVMSCVSLDKQPTGVESDSVFFKNEDQATRATTAVYDATTWYQSQEINEWAFGDVCSDDAEKGGEGPGDAAEMQQMKEFRAQPTSPYCQQMWVTSYEGIFRANLVINKVPLIDMDATLRDRYVAEAKVLRTLFYFRLVRLFGDVPLVLKQLERAEYCQARTPVAQVWAQMEQDLSEAANVLPEKSKYPAAEVGRMTKGAANALLTKVYIYQKKWQLAKDRAQMVIDSKEYGLEPNYKDIFTLAKENGIESIFDFQHITFGSGWSENNEGCVTQTYQTSRTNKWNAGWGYVCPTDNFVNEFEAGDPRLKLTVICSPTDTIFKGTKWENVGDTIYKGIAAAEEIPNNNVSPNHRHGRKYLMEYTASPPGASNGPANWRFIRYADLLLWHAEAACELGDAATALASLKLVRDRARASFSGADAAGLLPEVTTTDQAALRTAIYHERRVELGLEGHRFFDIIRTDRGTACLGANGYTDNKKLFPIPQTEIDVCPKLTQNSYFQ